MEYNEYTGEMIAIVTSKCILNTNSNGVGVGWSDFEFQDWFRSVV